MVHSNEKEAILYIQRALLRLSLSDPGIPAPPLTGSYDDVTRSGVVVFQEKNHLPGTGKVDPATWDTLQAAYEAALEESSPACALSLFPRHAKNTVICAGEQSFHALCVQFMLREIGMMYDHYEELELTGVYDEPTEKLIRDFQAKNLLPPTGEVDRHTWDCLAQAYEICARDCRQ